MSEKNDKSEAYNGLGFILYAVGIIIMFIAFHGDPDVVDAIRVIFLNWAGLSQVQA